jgi:hypothetical protein
MNRIFIILLFFDSTYHLLSLCKKSFSKLGCFRSYESSTGSNWALADPMGQGKQKTLRDS